MTKVENLIQSFPQSNFTHQLKSQQCYFSEFQTNFQTIKAFVQDLRQFPIQITAKEDSHILKYTKTILEFLQHPEALKNQKLYRNSLISLGNFLSLKYTFFPKENMTDRFFKNLVDYFVFLTQHQHEQDFNMLIYPVFYIIVLMIYNQDKETSKKLFEKVFVKKFMRALCSVDFKEGNKIERYLPVMIAFMSKGVNNQESNGLLKELVLKNLHFSQHDKNGFQFIYSLRVLINKEGFSLGDVRKYGLLDHLERLLEKNIHLQQQVSMVLEVLRHILKRHQILGYKIVTGKFMDLLQKAYKVSQQETLGLVEIIIPCLSYGQKMYMLEVHSESLRKAQDESREWVEEKEVESLKIVSMIAEEMALGDVMRLMEVFSVETLLRRALEGEKVLGNDEQEVVLNFMMKLTSSMEKNALIKESFLDMVGQFSGRNRKLALLIQRYAAQARQVKCLE